MFIDKLISSGISPSVDVSNYHFNNKHKDVVQNFVKNKSNVAIYGEHSYEYAIKLLRMKIVYNMDTKIYFNTHSSVIIHKIEGLDFDVVAIVNIFPNIKFNVCGLVDYFSSMKQVLISSVNFDSLYEALGNCWPVIDNCFEVIKL